jgi:ABC-type uncharacterized transport system permease subunit
MERRRRQKLKYWVKMHGGKDWVAIAALVLGRQNSIEMHGGKDWAAVAELVLG